MYKSDILHLILLFAEANDPNLANLVTYLVAPAAANSCNEY